MTLIITIKLTFKQKTGAEKLIIKYHETLKSILLNNKGLIYILFVC